ncbi:hypothetical protein Goarm_017896 [Gossypium armourianum]|uniref:Uncharacterized protein n=1 Tax=Gossypium armourianum TaxID=34283 RepID=A0A7J9IGQ9_9ROSI|nr:hypothetical protein [Gossypium armourianum]
MMLQSKVELGLLMEISSP